MEERLDIVSVKLQTHQVLEDGVAGLQRGRQLADVLLLQVLRRRDLA
jgi:hypothetical protein